MHGFGAFLRKEFHEIVRTWRIWVLPGILMFLALSGPVLALLTPELMKSLTTGQTGLVIELPEPSWIDAYGQWVKNLAQMVTYALIIILGGMVSAERRSGTAVLVLTKPLTRAAFVLAKFASQAAFVGVSAVIGTVVTWLTTLVVFGEAPVRELAEPTAIWLVSAVMLVAFMTLFSSLVGSQAGAAGLGFGALIALSIFGLWGPARDFSPAGLIGAPTALLAGESVPLVWPLVTGGLAAVLALALAVRVFRRIEL